MPTPVPASSHGPVPRARIDPIVTADQALAVFRLAMSDPLAAETLVMFVDHSGCGHDLVSVSGTTEPNHVIDVAETMAMCASVGTDITSSDIRGLIMATVRPGGGLVEGDDELWLEAADAVQQTGLVLIEWFVIGRGGVHSPRELLGIPARWTAGRNQLWQPHAEPQPPPDGCGADAAPCDELEAPTLANTESRRTELS